MEERYPGFSPRIKKGRFAFNYFPDISIKDKEWYKNFEIFVPGNILNKDLVEEFHFAGTRLFFYEWTNSFYNHDRKKRQFLDDLVTKEKNLLLNTYPDEKNSWHYDMGNSELVEKRVKEIHSRLKNANYDGIFFDCVCSFRHADKELLKEFKKRHPVKEYSDALALFFSELKKTIWPRKIFTNQAYKDPKIIVHSDYDLSESYMTTHAKSRMINVKGKDFKLTNIHPWYDKTKLYESTKFIVKKFTVDNIPTGHKTEILHLNYSYPVPSIDGEFMPDKESIHYSLAAAYMFGHNTYVQSQEVKHDMALNHDNIYFVDIGEAVSGMKDLSENVSYREFERGLVIINGSGKDISIGVDSEFYDLYENRPIKQKRLDIPVNLQPDGKLNSTGRIFYKI